MKIVNYFEVSANFNLAPAQAVAFFQAKGLKPTFAWQDMLGDEHDTAFTVAKMLDTDLLHTVKSKLDGALASGQSFGAFKKELMPLLQKAGWWGKKDVIDTLTGKVVKAQLGSASRLETIFRTNLQSAYAVGQWQQIADQAQSAPFLMYDAVDDTRTRPEHKAHDNLVLPVTSEFWSTHYPPNGWACRCGVIQLDGHELKAHGLKVGSAPPVNTHAWTNPRTGATQFVPDDLDPGWDHNPGKKRLETLQNALREKAGRLPSEQRRAIMASSIEPANRRRTRIYEALKGLQQLTTNNTPAGRIKKPRRSLWADFPDVLIQADETTAKKNPHYKAAKEGDIDAAVALLSDVLDAGKLKELVEAVGSRQPIVVPVMAVEGRSVNVIPSVFAEITAGILQTSVSADIIQINRVAHTGSSGFHRLATPALFAGDVVEGADYLIVDDFIGQGGTLANIRGYIERHGARVIFSSVLAGKSYSARIALSEARLSTLREKHGEELENWWRETYGYDFRFLTESEARYLERTQDADTIRAKLAAALLKAGE